MEERLTYVPKEKEDEIAREIIEFLRPKELPIWQVKGAFVRAKSLVEWETLK